MLSCNNNSSPKVEGKDTVISVKAPVTDSLSLLNNAIRNIDSASLAIETSRKLRTVKKDVTGKSTEGGEVIKFFKDKDLVMAAISYYGEMGKSIATYYIRGNAIMKIKSEESHYNKPMYIEGSVIDSTEVNFFYIINGSFVVLNKQMKFISDTSLLTKGKELMDDYKEEMK